MNETELLQNALERIFAFVRANPWIGVSTVGIWFAMRAIQTDIMYVPTVPARLRIFCLPVFVIVSVVSARYEASASWFVAIIGSVLAAFGAMYFHESVVNALRRGRAIFIPFLTIAGAAPSPTAPVTKPVVVDPPQPPAA